MEIREDQGKFEGEGKTRTEGRLKREIERGGM